MIEKKDYVVRVTFNSDFVKELSAIVLPIIKKSLKGTVGEKPFLHPTHADILFYEMGGVFEVHKDIVPKFPYPKKNDGRWRMYSCIIGLDSNLDYSSDDGNTCVYLPSFSSAITIEIANNDLSEWVSNKVRLLNLHLFAEGCIRGGLLFFPAEAPHSSRKIKKFGGFKLAIKHDFWVHIKKPSMEIVKLYSHPYFSPLFLQSLNKKNPLLVCQCKLCSPTKLAAKKLSKILLLISSKQCGNNISRMRDLPEYILLYIAYYVVSDKNQFEGKTPRRISQKLPEYAPYDCVCNSTVNKLCQCTCSSCIFNYECSFSLEQLEESSSSEESHTLQEYEYCNGYDDY